jgi:hypothetical protein
MRRCGGCMVQVLLESWRVPPAGREAAKVFLLVDDTAWRTAARPANVAPGPIQHNTQDRDSTRGCSHGCFPGQEGGERGVTAHSARILCTSTLRRTAPVPEHPPQTPQNLHPGVHRRRPCDVVGRVGCRTAGRRLSDMGGEQPTAMQLQGSTTLPGLLTTTSRLPSV